jgi:hypothetical protein
MTDNERDAARYQVVRRLNVNQFAQIYHAALVCDIPFDEIIDALMSGFIYWQGGYWLAGDTRLDKIKHGNWHMVV